MGPCRPVTDSTLEVRTVTNFDPGGFLMLLTVIPAVAAGFVSVGLALLTSRIGYGDYETNVVMIVGLMLVGWLVTALIITTSMLQILAVSLAMVGAFAVTRSVTAASIGWVLGVVLLFVVFIGLDVLSIYQGVDPTGRPTGLISRHLYAFYYGGLLVCGGVGGKAVQSVLERWEG